jgi:hypothetical protein
MPEFDPTVTLSLLASVATVVFAWWRTRRHAVDERFKSGAKRMDQHDLDIAALQQSLAALPGKDDMHRLQLMLSEMAGDMKATRATMRAMNESLTRQERITGRHEKHLLENSK